MKSCELPPSWSRSPINSRYESISGKNTSSNDQIGGFTLQTPIGIPPVLVTLPSYESAGSLLVKNG